MPSGSAVVPTKAVDSHIPKEQSVKQGPLNKYTTQNRAMHRNQKRRKMINTSDRIPLQIRSHPKSQIKTIFRGSTKIYRNGKTTAENHEPYNGQTEQIGGKKQGVQQNVSLASFFYANIQGLYPKSNQAKVAMLKELAYQRNLIFLALTETHLTRDHLDAEVTIDGYTIHRADRKNRSHGEVIIYTRNYLAACIENVESFSNGTVELLKIYIKNLDMLVMTVYRPPNTTLDKFEEILARMRVVLDTLLKSTTEVMILGDFNLPHIHWPNMRILGGTLEEKQQSLALKNVTDKYFLLQEIREPTSGKNILDLMLTNSNNLIFSCEIRDTILSEHKYILVETTCVDQQKDHERRAAQEEHLGNLNFYNKNINWGQIRAEIKTINWEAHLQKEDVDDILREIVVRCREICSKHIPKKTKNKKRSIIPRDRKILMRKRHSCSISLSRTHFPPAQEKIKSHIEEIEKKIKLSHEEEHRREEQEAVLRIKENPKYFFSYAKKKLKNRSVIGPLYDLNGELTEEPKQMTNILKSQYESVFSDPKKEMVEDAKSFFTDSPNSPQILSSIKISEQDTIEAIKAIPPEAAAGHDGFHAQLLRNCGQELAKPLRMLWDLSTKSGTVPTTLKTSIITPIHKGSSRGQASRTQQVSVQGKLSEPINVKSGVPQGSVLGPLLFIIHVGDIDNKLKYTEASSFADDTRLKRQIAGQEDAANIQKDLKEIQIWATSNNMVLNGEKFELVRYGRNKDLKNSTSYKYNNQPIKEKEHVKDLGVYMGDTTPHHINKEIEAGKNLIGNIYFTQYDFSRGSLRTPAPKESRFLRISGPKRTLALKGPQPQRDFGPKGTLAQKELRP
ncbi:uncharacterized protein LOC143041638 [Oratosquilla oratoria]|uniref:uncharacterized protein LOC143041638 n=1 Tax=Oratosquilla oratoria TaxID=337810 RepID=UPI003F75BA07